MTLKQAIQQLADRKHEVYSKVCAVDSVDKTNKTCNVIPINGDVEVENVRLQADSTGKGIVLVPTVRSFVIVDFQNTAAACVIMTSEIDDVIFDINGSYSLKSVKNIDLECQGDLTLRTAGKLEIAGGSGALKDVLNDMLTLIQGLTFTSTLGDAITVTKGSITSLQSEISNLFK